MLRFFGILIISSLLLGCSNAKKASNSNDNNPNQKVKETPGEDSNAQFDIAQMDYPQNSIAGIKRTYCYGTCPVYSMYLLDDFTLVYLGEKNVEKIGRYTAKASQADYQMLLVYAEEVGYFDLNDEYVAEVMDVPTVYSTLVDKSGKRKTITNLFMAPDNLTEFESYLDSLFEGKNWIKESDK